MDIRKGVLNYVDSNTTKMQTVQVEGLAGEVASEVERYQSFGLTTFPRPVDTDGKGAECIIADLGSSSMRTVISLDDRRYRPVVGNPGDVILYSTHDTPTATHDNATQRIVFTDDATANYRFILKINQAKIEVKSDNTVVVNNANGSITINADGSMTMTAPATGLTINGAVTINGNVATIGTLKNNNKNVGSTHVHTSVTSGSSNSGVPA